MHGGEAAKGVFGGEVVVVWVVRVVWVEVSLVDRWWGDERLGGWWMWGWLVL